MEKMFVINKEQIEHDIERTFSLQLLQYMKLGNKTAASIFLEGFISGLQSTGLFSEETIANYVNEFGLAVELITENKPKKKNRCTRELDEWVGGCKVRVFPWIDNERIYVNVQYYAPSQSLERPPAWDKTVFVIDNAAGQRLVFDLTHSLVNHISFMEIADGTEVTLMA